MNIDYKIYADSVKFVSHRNVLKKNTAEIWNNFEKTMVFPKDFENLKLFKDLALNCKCFLVVGF